MTVDSTTLRQVMAQFATGVAVVTASLDDGVPAAMTANAVASLSLEPPLILFCPVRTSNTLGVIKKAGRFAMNILHDGQEELARRYARSGPKSFDGVETEPGISGAPHLKDCIAWVDCEVHAVYEGGDHEIVVGRVLAAQVNDRRAPLLFFRSEYRSTDL